LKTTIVRKLFADNSGECEKRSALETNDKKNENYENISYFKTIWIFFTSFNGVRGGGFGADERVYLPGQIK
jgi:hypothetical protein